MCNSPFTTQTLRALTLQPSTNFWLLARASCSLLTASMLCMNRLFLSWWRGQSSKGPYWRNVHENNDVLSYERALALVNFWEAHDVSLRDANHAQKCELLVCGSGDKGVMRMMPDVPTNAKNQRFLIHVIPKPGMIEHKTSNNYSSTTLSTNNTDIP